jgi:hypothetical protein
MKSIAGQLGNSSNGNALSPQIVHGPWISPTGEPAAPKRVLDGLNETPDVRKKKMRSETPCASPPPRLSILPIINFLSSNLLTGMTGISLTVQ